ncbi:MAG: MMPL family transporter [Solirubrobacterales bacterium]|nr:MMPL family transporter [Solirubrobacterales bacterium]
MLRLARFSISRPRTALALWAAFAVALSLIGLGVSDALSPSKAVIPGTDSARAVHLADAQFGPSQLVPVLLEGPQKEVDRQGPILVKRLSKEKDIRVMSAWDGGPLSFELHPQAGDAMLIAAVARTDAEMFEGRQEEIQKIVDDTVKAPVTPYVTGTPALERGLADASIDTTRQALLIATPILFVLLLLILRAPVAAFVITGFGAVTAFVGFGAMTLAANAIDLAPVALALGALTSLAAGVGYALLLYVRWADELAAGASPRDAATTAVDTSGRAVLIGGTALVVAMVVTALVGLTEMLQSEGLGTVLGGLLGIGATVVVMPAALVVLGTRMHWLRFPAPAFAEHAWNRLVGGGNVVVRRAVPVGALATGLLLLLALPVLQLDIGTISPLRLPDDNQARVAYEKVGAVMGPGWVAPYNMVIVSQSRPLTDPKLLRDIDRLQIRIGRHKYTETVVGPGVFAATSKELGVLPDKLQESSKLLKTGPKDLAKLENGLGQAGAGAVTLQSGLQEAAAGAGKLSAGSTSAQGGAGQLRAGLAKARSGSAQISGGLGQALGGARQLRDGASAALAGSAKISGGLGQAVTPVKQGLPVVKNMAADVTSGSNAVKNAKASADTVTGQLDAAIADLQGIDDPKAQAALAALQNARGGASSLSGSLGAASSKLGGAAAVAGVFAGQVAELSSGLSQLYAGSTALQGGLAQLRKGNADLVNGIDRLAAGGGDLTAGLTALRNGAGQLESGLGQLSAGNASLAGGLSAGVAPVGRLSGGLAEMEQGVATFRKKLPSARDLDRLSQQSPGLFDNGYFVLAAIAGARPADRNQATFAVNLDRGGNAGQILIVPRFGAGSTENIALGEDLRDMADGFAAATRTEVALGGQAGQFGDFESEGTAKLIPVFAVVAAVVALMLMLMLRTVILPLVAVAFSLLATAVSFGVLQILFGGDDPLLGGPGSFSPVSIMGIFAAAFGIATMLQVVLLERTREDFLEDGDPHQALLRSLRETAPAATGAAIAMIAAAVPFMVSSFLTVAQFGIGLAVAILVDAVIVRPVLLPAAVEVFGARAWWPTRSKVAPPPAPAPSPGPPVPGKLVHG